MVSCTLMQFLAGASGQVLPRRVVRKALPTRPLHGSGGGARRIDRAPAARVALVKASFSPLPDGQRTPAASQRAGSASLVPGRALDLLKCFQRHFAGDEVADDGAGVVAVQVDAGPRQHVRGRLPGLVDPLGGSRASSGTQRRT